MCEIYEGNHQFVQCKCTCNHCSQISLRVVKLKLADAFQMISVEKQERKGRQASEQRKHQI